METTTQDSAEKVMEDLRALVQDGEQLLRSGAGEVGARGRELRARLQATIDKAKAACQSLQDKAIAGAKVTDQAIREHPYQAAGVAFGVGLLIGVLASRNR